MTTVDVEKLREMIIAMLRTVYDPEIPVNIYDLGLIYEVDANAEGAVKVRMTLTSPSCPVAETLPPEVEQRMRELPGVSEAKVEVVWEPPWTKDMMTEAAKLELNLL